MAVLLLTSGESHVSPGSVTEHDGSTNIEEQRKDQQRGQQGVNAERKRDEGESGG